MAGERTEKILIVSDTHGHLTNYETVLKKVGPVDQIIHLGDAERTEDQLAALSDAPFHMVGGNCDQGAGLPLEEELQLGPYRAFLTHGHRYNVNWGLRELLEEARDRGVSLILYGHTHQPKLVREEGVVLLNPGSLTKPRQENGKPSYALMEIDKDGVPHFNICYL